MTDPLASNSHNASAALEHVRQIVALCRTTSGDVARADGAPPIRSVGIVGAGIMGTAIAREHAAHGIPAVLLDADAESLRRAARSLKRTYATLTQYTQSNSDLDGCDLVIESITEKRPAKQALYEQLSLWLAKGGILATNTSTIPIARLASGLAVPERFCGMHFCHPVRLRPLVEIIAGAKTAAETVATLSAHSLSLDWLPLLVADGPGFVVNRLLMAYVSAALELLVSGVSPHDIDAAMLGFGMPMGPLRQLDEIGLDTALHSGMVLSEVSEHRSQGTLLLVALVKAKQLGMKAGAGIYRYPDSSVNPALEGFIERSRSTGEAEQSPTTLDQIVKRLLAPMVSEAARLIDEGGASNWQIDVATIFGLGFPCWRGGLLYWEKQNSMR
jgi:3-hydroxyacyl-CoA dehydrogenase